MTSDRLSPPESPESLIGTWRRFGPTGPAYQIIAVGPAGRAGEATMRVHVAESGEHADIRLAGILDDPIA